jgi:hypothetical protein
VPFLVALLLLACAWGAWDWWSAEREVSRPPGVVAPDEPRQQPVPDPRRISVHDVVLETRARFEIRARVLRRENYRFDGGATIAPVDLAVGWGPLSDSAVIDQLEFSQMGRFFYWKPRDPVRFPLAPATLITSAAQLHLIPADGDLERRARRLRPGQVVTIGGWLVDVSGPRGFEWRTSLRRDDTGDGACEVVYVESLDAD